MAYHGNVSLTLIPFSLKFLPWAPSKAKSVYCTLYENAAKPLQAWKASLNYLCDVAY